MNTNQLTEVCFQLNISSPLVEESVTKFLNDKPVLIVEQSIKLNDLSCLFSDILNAISGYLDLSARIVKLNN